MSVKTGQSALRGLKDRASETATTAKDKLNAKERKAAMLARSGDRAKLRRGDDLGAASLSDLPKWMDYMEARGEHKAEQMFEGDTRISRAAQTGTVLTVVTLGLTIILGILVYSEVKTALPTPEDESLANASENSTNTFADAMELAPVIMIVLLAAVVLAVVQRFR